MMNGRSNIVADLVAAGVSVQDIWDVVNSPKQYPEAIPVLMRWLENLEEWSEPPEREKLEEAIVRSLTVPAARKVAAPLLIRRFRETPYTETNRWVIGNALGVVADPSSWEEIARLIIDPTYGTARQMIVYGLGKWKNPRVVPVLIRLLDDPDVSGHAAHALGLLRAKEAQRKLIELASRGSPFQRREARAALRRVSSAEG